MANDFKFGNKSIANMLFGNKQVKQIWYGTKLIWEKIRKVLLQDDSEKYICIEYIPETDVNIESVSVFIQQGSAYAWTWILNGCGLCVARNSNGAGRESTTLYELTGELVTISSLGTPKLLAGRKYYIAYKNNQWENQSASNFSYYQGLTGNYKNFAVNGNVNVYTQKDLQSIPFIGDFYNLGVYNTSSKEFTPSDFYGSACVSNVFFVWHGGDINGIAFSNSRNPMFTSHDMRKMRGMITDGMLNSCNNDMQRLALIYYIAGNVEGNEIGWGAQYNYPTGITVNGTQMFNDGVWTIYKTTGNIVKNRITSMTPLTDEPSNPEQFSIYYKGQTSSGWLDSGGNPITNEAVVAYTGSCWEIATSWTLEFTTQTDTLANSIDIVGGNDGNYAGNFNDATLNTDKKYYLRINGNEV